VSFPRPLSDREAETLSFLLSADDPRLAPLRVQAETATVVRTCTCGCATIDFAVDRTRTQPASGLPMVPVESVTVEQNDPDRIFWLFLFLDHGWLSSIEIAYLDVIPAEFPPLRDFLPPEVRG